MITTATARSTGRLDDASATRIADLWNTAYPDLRDILTKVITAHREYHDRNVGKRTEAQLGETRNYIKGMEDIRRRLGQLDRGTYRACTRSAGAFHPGAALMVVSAALEAVSLGDARAGAVYRLLAELSDATAALHTERRAEDRAV